MPILNMAWRREKVLTSVIYQQFKIYETEEDISDLKLKKTAAKYVSFMKKWKNETEILKTYVELVHTCALRNSSRQRVLQPFLREMIMGLRKDLKTGAEKKLAFAQWKLIRLICQGDEENREILRESQAEIIAKRHFESCKNLKGKAVIKNVLNLISEKSSTDIISRTSAKSSPSLVAKSHDENDGNLPKRSLPKNTEKIAPLEGPALRLQSEKEIAQETEISDNTVIPQPEGDEDATILEIVSSEQSETAKEIGESEELMETADAPISRTRSRSSSDEYFTCQDRIPTQETNEVQAPQSCLNGLAKSHIDHSSEKSNANTTDQPIAIAENAKAASILEHVSPQNPLLSPGRKMLDDLVANHLRKQEQILRAEIIARRRSHK